MRVNREQLIQQAQARIAELTQQADADYAAAQAKEAEKASAYEQETREHWAVLVGNVQDRLNAEQPILETDIPAALRMSGYGYRPSTVARRSPATAELRRMVALLQASPDETVSLASLERAGFTLAKTFKVGQQ